MTSDDAARIGPELLRTLKYRDLTPEEQAQLTEVKKACKCHKTDNPEQFSSNGEDCDLCGRRIGIVTVPPHTADLCA